MGMARLILLNSITSKDLWFSSGTSGLSKASFETGRPEEVPRILPKPGLTGLFYRNLRDGGWASTVATRLHTRNETGTVRLTGIPHQ